MYTHIYVGPDANKMRTQAIAVILRWSAHECQSCNSKTFPLALPSTVARWQRTRGTTLDAVHQHSSLFAQDGLYWNWKQAICRIVCYTKCIRNKRNILFLLAGAKSMVNKLCIGHFAERMVPLYIIYPIILLCMFCKHLFRSVWTVSDVVVFVVVIVEFRIGGNDAHVYRCHRKADVHQQTVEDRKFDHGLRWTAIAPGRSSEIKMGCRSRCRKAKGPGMLYSTCCSMLRTYIYIFVCWNCVRRNLTRCRMASTRRCTRCARWRASFGRPAWSCWRVCRWAATVAIPISCAAFVVIWSLLHAVLRYTRFLLQTTRSARYIS